MSCAAPRTIRDTADEGQNARDPMQYLRLPLHGWRLTWLPCSLRAQFGHLFAKGDTREAAIRAMVVALKEVKIRGEIRTTVDYAVEMIQSPDFVGNNIHTGWLDARISSHVRLAALLPLKALKVPANPTTLRLRKEERRSNFSQRRPGRGSAAPSCAGEVVCFCGAPVHMLLLVLLL